jgi:hypothetical protein
MKLGSMVSSRRTASSQPGKRQLFKTPAIYFGTPFNGTRRAPRCKRSHSSLRSNS